MTFVSLTVCHMFSLQKAAAKVELNCSLTYYFSLYLEEKTGDKWTCKTHTYLPSPPSHSHSLFQVYRHLQDHEAPFVSLKTVNNIGSFCVTLRMK